jgi:hypothetical protein
MEMHDIDKIDLLTFVTGGSDEKNAARVQAHILGCDSCRSYVERFRSENDSFLGSHPIDETVPSFASAPTGRPVRFRMRSIYGIAASIVIAFTTGYLLRPQEPMPSSRTKGAVGLTLYVKNAQGEIEKRKEQVYSAGERIQFLYSCDERNKFILLSIDASGAVTQYFPFQGDSSESLEPGQDIPLSHSILLDEYVGKELFIGVFSEKKLPAAAVKGQLRADFDRTRNIDSTGLSIKDVVVWEQPVAVIKGKTE